MIEVGGIEYFVTRNVAIEAGLAVSKGVFTTAEVNGDRVEDPDEDFTSTRLNLGITLHP